MKNESYQLGDYVKITSGSHAGKFAYAIVKDDYNPKRTALAVIEGGIIQFFDHDSFTLVHKSKISGFEPKEGDKVKVAYDMGPHKAGDTVIMRGLESGLCKYKISLEDATKYDYRTAYIVLPLKPMKGGGSALSLLGTPQKPLR